MSMAMITKIKNKKLQTYKFSAYQNDTKKLQAIDTVHERRKPGAIPDH